MSRRTATRWFPRFTLVAICFGLLSANAFAGRVPTKYNDRYQALYAEQELFRKRPELLGCIALARDYAQSSGDGVFNKLRFTPKSVQTAFVAEGVRQGTAYQSVLIYGEGRVRAYSFFENWEPAVIRCDIPVQGASKVVLEMGKDMRSTVTGAAASVHDVTKN